MFQSCTVTLICMRSGRQLQNVPLRLSVGRFNGDRNEDKKMINFSTHSAPCFGEPSSVDWLTAYSYSSKNGNLSRKNEKEQIDYYTYYYPHIILLEQLRSACLLVGAPSPKRPSHQKRDNSYLLGILFLVE